MAVPVQYVIVYFNKHGWNGSAELSFVQLLRLSPVYSRKAKTYFSLKHSTTNHSSQRYYIPVFCDVSTLSTPASIYAEHVYENS